MKSLIIGIFFTTSIYWILSSMLISSHIEPVMQAQFIALAEIDSIL